MPPRSKKFYVICANNFDLGSIPLDLGSYGYERVLLHRTEPKRAAADRLADDILDVHFARASAEGDCHAYITNLNMLTKELARQCDRIFLDTRGASNLASRTRARRSKVSLITSMFKTDPFISGFLDNCRSLNLYDTLCDHIFIATGLSVLERRLLLEFSQNHSNILIVWNRKDPGLYNCWKQGIEFASTPYISNANVDDLRHSLHVSELVDCMDRNPDICLATTAIVPFYTYTADITEIDATEPWYVDQAGEFSWWHLASLNYSESEYSLKPNNLPHSSPMWRKSLHDTHGFFDEESFGTFADWAFWLKVFQSGERGYLSPKPYGYYYINLESHNRRGDRLDEYHRAIEDRFGPLFVERHNSNSHKLTKIEVRTTNVSPPQKLLLCGRDQEFGEHRNSFNRLVTTLEPLHRPDARTKFIPFIERYFVWGTEDGEAASGNPRAIEEDWVGIIHCPFDSPGWFDRSISPETIFESELWQQSEAHCRGLICLSEDLEIDLNRARPNLLTLSLKHPTELNVPKFDLRKYRTNPRVVQVGDWLRKLQSIFQITGSGHKRIFLTKSGTQNYLEREVSMFGDFRSGEVDTRYFVPNEEYDDLLQSSVALCLMYGTAANNALIECIARSTPIIVNPLPSVIEYLGPKYPLYAELPLEVDDLLSDATRIQAAHYYLEDLDKSYLSYDRFYTEILRSDLYANLK